MVYTHCAMEELDKKLIHLLIVLPDPCLSHIELFGKLPDNLSLVGEPGLTAITTMAVALITITQLQVCQVKHVEVVQESGKQGILPTRC